MTPFANKNKTYLNKGILAFFLASNACTKIVNQETLKRVNLDPSETVCAPFEDNVSAGPEQNSGLVAELISSNTRTRHLDDFENTENTTVISDGVFMNKIDIQPRRFDTGFPTEDGSLLKDSNGTPLTEWFRLNIESHIHLPNDMPAGDYVIRTLSDDGVRVHIGEQENIINNPGLHGPTYDIASELIQFIGLGRNHLPAFIVDFRSGRNVLPF